jgi:hypothetical protein
LMALSERQRVNAGAANEYLEMVSSG